LAAITRPSSPAIAAASGSAAMTDSSSGRLSSGSLATEARKANSPSPTIPARPISRNRLTRVPPSSASAGKARKPAATTNITAAHATSGSNRKPFLPLISPLRMASLANGIVESVIQLTC